MGRVTMDYLINYRLAPTQCSPNVFRVLGCVDMLNRKMGTNLTWHDVNWVYNCQKGEKTKYYIKCRVPTTRLISCLLDSSKGMDEDFLIVLGDWHNVLHCPTHEGDQVGFSWTIDMHRMLLDFINMKIFLSPLFFFNSWFSLFSLANEYHTAPAKHLVNFRDMNRILKSEIFLHRDG